MKLYRYAPVLSALLLAGCADTIDLTLNLTEEITNHSYIGNGIEWDPYDEAESWGAPLSENDWNKLFSRLDYMRPAYVRCMINSPFRYYDAATGEYQSSRNFSSMEKLLDYCRKNDIMVVFGEYNPPAWSMKQDQKWVDMSVDYLNMLVNEKGYTCIKHFVIFNEPDGDWASTDGDFDMWLSMLKRFHAKMSEYPGLLDKVSLAGPDVVADYKNSHSSFDTSGWLRESVEKADSLLGLYDIHAYPGRKEVIEGGYTTLLKSYRELIPEGKQIILGEAGYKYWREADADLMAEYNRRVDGHPFTKGSDCNMLVYDNFYGIDMPVFVSEVMNSGFSGVAAWMLDDAMHSQGDSGKPEDIKIWGMWNILGEEVFSDPSQEEIRPWYYTWSLMCRYFPKGCNVLKITADKEKEGIFSVAAVDKNNHLTVTVINVTDEAQNIKIKFPHSLKDGKLFRYTEQSTITLGTDGFPVPERTGIEGNDATVSISGDSFILITEHNY